jgi:hypothetical protein
MLPTAFADWTKQLKYKDYVCTGIVSIKNDIIFAYESNEPVTKVLAVPWFVELPYY